MKTNTDVLITIEPDNDIYNGKNLAINYQHRYFVTNNKQAQVRSSNKQIFAGGRFNIEFYKSMINIFRFIGEDHAQFLEYMQNFNNDNGVQTQISADANQISPLIATVMLEYMADGLTTNFIDVPKHSYDKNKYSEFGQQVYVLLDKDYGIDTRFYDTNNYDAFKRDRKLTNQHLMGISSTQHR